MKRRLPFPLWVWDVYILARKRDCGREAAFRLYWEIQPDERPTAEYIVAATRALLYWRRINAADALLALLCQANDREAFLWTALTLAQE